MAGEWSLVAFTISGQLAVGIYAFIGGPLFLGAATPGIAAGGARLAVVLAVLGCLVVATGLSLFHLHHPFRAYKVFSNLGTSWLSREVFFELLFLGIAGLLGLREWRGAGGAAFAKALFILGGLAGGLFILAMSRLYMLPAVAPWNHAYTPVSFCLTAFVLGSVASAVFFGLSAERPDAYRVLPAVSLVSVMACLVNAALLDPGRGLFGAKAGPSLRPPGVGMSRLHAARISGLSGAAVLLAAGMAAGEGRLLGIAARPIVFIAAFSLVAAGEISGRFLFYRLSGRRACSSNIPRNPRAC